MIKVKKIIPLILFSFLISFFTYRLCYFLAEKYFFDKFFYQKSIAHGYILNNHKLNLSEYKDRSQDLIALDISQLQNDPSKYQIIIIGDSFVWGNGLKNSQRFSNLLNTKLSKKNRPYRIISLSFPGWNILDYLRTYQKVIEKISPNLVIFSLVENDIFVGQRDEASPIFQKCISEHKNFPPSYDYDLLSENLDKKHHSFESAVLNAWANPTNICVLDNSLSLLPTDKTIYFITTDYFGNSNLYKKYKEELSLNKKYILDTKINPSTSSKYLRYYKDIGKNFIISPKEGHPNTLANQMYADILYNEITTNPQWGFIK